MEQSYQAVLAVIRDGVPVVEVASLRRLTPGCASVTSVVGGSWPRRARRPFPPNAPVFAIDVILRRTTTKPDFLTEPIMELVPC